MASTSTSHFMLLLIICVSTLSIIGIAQADGVESTSTLPFSLISPATNQQVTCPVPQNRCGSECERRCSATSHKKPCLFFCNKCCNTCLCVPPGTYGNKECCPCYNNWKTKEGKPKCP
ncbi:gibberellin-regulated protein 5-like [Primulina huaijiensis]|uniref:gibberellin-regulated protein 5-like n=1 Tax=Primulina huaijiensis TaxID=1492673 RepID=UPI003CC788FB